MKFFSELVTIIAGAILCPIAFGHSRYHYFTTGHPQAIEMFNFRYRIYCMECDKVFVNEDIDND